MSNIGKIEDLLINKGLYDAIELDVNDLAEMEKCLSQSEYSGNNIDCYCVCCRTNRIFEFSNSEIKTDTGVVRVNIFDEAERAERVKNPPKREVRFKSFLDKRYVLTYICTRDKQHAILFDLIATGDNKLFKIGQYPSVADLAVSEISKYETILDEQYLEFSKAIGLFAHGIGIGSFVYLRRIIEKLVFNRYKQFAAELRITEEEFTRLHFDQKISALKNHLPPVLVTNKNLYGIISKGVHELSDDECKSMFPPIKVGIELILDDLLAEKERIEKEKQLASFVAKKTGELKK